MVKETKMAKAGRPKGSTKNVDPKKTIAVRVEHPLFKQVQKRAKEDGRSISSYVRWLMVQDTQECEINP